MGKAVSIYGIHFFLNEHSQKRTNLSLRENMYLGLQL